MSIQRLDHVNLRTRDLDRMRRFYADTLGMTFRPRDGRAHAGFAFGVGDAVHLHVIASPDVEPSSQPQIEHFAFCGLGLESFMQRLDAAETAYNLSVSPEEGLVRVNLRDPDDNRLHVDFPIGEWEHGMAPRRLSAR